MIFLGVQLPLQKRTGALKLSIHLNQVQFYLENKFATFGVQISPAIGWIQLTVKIPKKSALKNHSLFGHQMTFPPNGLGWKQMVWLNLKQPLLLSWTFEEEGGFHTLSTTTPTVSILPSQSSRGLTSALGQRCGTRAESGSRRPPHFSWDP